MLRLFISALLLFSTLSTYGQLQYKGFVYAQQAGSSVHSKSGDFLYLVHKSMISVYKVDQSTGKLSRVQHIKTNFGGEISGPHLSGNGRFLYSSLGKKVNGETMRTFVMYEVNQKTGKLTFKKNFESDPEFRREFISHFSVSPKGNLMFFGENESRNLKVYKIDPSTGIPTYLSEYVTDYLQHWTRFHVSPDQRNLYVGGGNSFKEVVVYSLDEHTGAVNQIQEIESIGQFSSSWDLLVSADGKHLYKVDGRDDQKILQFERDIYSGTIQLQRTYDRMGSSGKAPEMHFFFSDRNTDFLYGLHSFGDGDAIHVIKRDPNSGNLTYKRSYYDRGTTNRLNGVFQMSFSRNNRYVYASGMWDGALNIFYNPETRQTIDFNLPETQQPITTHSTDEPVIIDRPTTTHGGPITSGSGGMGSIGNGISGKELSAIRTALAAETSDITRLERSYELLEGKYIKTVQAAGLAYLFKSEFKRLEFVKFISYFLADPQNKHMLAELFQYENMQAEVRNL